MSSGKLHNINPYHWKCSSNFLISGIWHSAWTHASDYLHHFPTCSTLCLLSELLSLPLWTAPSPYGWIYCLTALNKQHNIRKIALFQKGPNDSHALRIKSNWSRLPSLLSNFPITEYILYWAFFLGRSLSWSPCSPTPRICPMCLLNFSWIPH